MLSWVFKNVIWKPNLEKLSLCNDDFNVDITAFNILKPYKRIK